MGLLYVLFMSVVFIFSPQKNSMEYIYREDVVSNCQMWLKT